MRIKQNGVCIAAYSARAALSEIWQFNHATRRADQIPADTFSQIADLAAPVGAPFRRRCRNSRAP